MGTKSINRRNRTRLSMVIILFVVAGALLGVYTFLAGSLLQSMYSPTIRPSSTRPTETIVGSQPTTVEGNQLASTEVSLPSTTRRKSAISSKWFANGAANRAPLRPVVVFNQPSSSVKGVSVSVDSLATWDQGGNPVGNPLWSRALLENLDKFYEPIQQKTASDKWTILIGWVPERFMGPQKVGRKASGEKMIPPTKGKDIQYYLKEYNASWHASFTEKGMTYHFQVVHRNALAVCIRERLHIHQYFVAPNPQAEPVIVYQCPCRHCVEPSGTKTRTPLLRVYPSFNPPSLRSTLKGEMEVVVPPAQQLGKVEEGECIEAPSAPWLLAPDASRFEFPYEGLSSDLDSLLRVQADENKIVLVGFFNKHWIDHLHNFYYSMVVRGNLSNFIVATTDQDALELCVKNRLPCLDATEYAELEEDFVDEKGHVLKVSEAMSWIKPRLATSVLAKGYGFWMVDLDMSWNGNPMNEVLSAKVDVAHQCDSSNKFSINSGFYLARANPRALRFMENLMVLKPEENSDQTSMKLFSRYDHTHGATHACLHKWNFNMKCNYKIDGSVKVVKGIETFKWIPFDRNRTKFGWKILHATCLNGALAKVKYLRTMNAWFLDDLDVKTSEAGGYCLSLPDGVKLGKQHMKTVHSKQYVTDTDDTFLKERH